MGKFILLISLVFANLTPSAYNVYSPEIVQQNNALVMYYGGWCKVSDLPTDAIYRSLLAPTINCSAANKVLIPSAPYVQINDPTLVQMPGGYWIMYMTCSTSLAGELSAQNICFATSWDGVTWSIINLLVPGYWLPSAVLKGGKVFLYANPTVSPNKQWLFDLGTSGVAIGTPVQISHSQPYNYSNVDVMCHPSVSLCQMVGENITPNASSFIDYLYSTDMVTWNLGAHKIIEAEPGKSVRTPAFHPDTAYYVYFGCAPTRDGLNNQICLHDWSP